MKKYLIPTLLILLSFNAIAQREQVLRINSQELNDNKYSVLLYPEFKDGVAYFLDGTNAKALMNYNLLSGNIMFVEGKDTLSLANPSKIYYIQIGREIFVYKDPIFVKKLSYFTLNPNVFVAERLYQAGIERKGPYGTYSSTSAATSQTDFSNNEGNNITYIKVDVNILLKKTTDIYIMTAEDELIPFKKNAIKKLFPKDEKAINNYITENNFNIEKPEDAVQIFFFIHNILPKK